MLSQPRERVSAITQQRLEQIAGLSDLSDPESEMAVISSALQRPELYPAAANIVQPADFFLLAHGFFWYAIGVCLERNLAVDSLTVTRMLDSFKDCPVKGPDALRELSSLYGMAPRSQHIEHYAQLVRSAALRLRIYASGHQQAMSAYNRELSDEGLVDYCNATLFKATEQYFGIRDYSAAGAMSRYQDIVEQRMKGDGPAWVKTGWSRWDHPVSGPGGLWPGDVNVLAGPEGFGKTTMMLSIIRNALNAGKRVALFTLEMRVDTEIMQVFTSMEAGIPKHVLRSGRLDAEQVSKFIAATARIANWPLLLVDEFQAASNPLTPLSLRRKLRFFLSQQAVDLVCIDGLWLMEHPDYQDNRPRAVHAITADLSTVSKGDIMGLSFPILITHQYKELVVSRSVKKPTIYMLSESAGVRRNTQSIWGLWRSKDSRHTEMHLLKDRGNGNQGVVGYWDYLKEYSMYEETVL